MFYGLDGHVVQIWEHSKGATWIEIVAKFQNYAAFLTYQHTKIIITVRIKIMNDALEMKSQICAVTIGPIGGLFWMTFSLLALYDRFSESSESLFSTTPSLQGFQTELAAILEILFLRC